jgi:hypothetical protein
MPVPAAMKSTNLDPSAWLRVKPRVDTEDPASVNAEANEPWAMA